MAAENKAFVAARSCGGKKEEGENMPGLHKAPDVIRTQGSERAASGAWIQRTTSFYQLGREEKTYERAALCMPGLMHIKCRRTNYASSGKQRGKKRKKNLHGRVEMPVKHSAFINFREPDPAFEIPSDLGRLSTGLPRGWGVRLG